MTDKVIAAKCRKCNLPLTTDNIVPYCDVHLECPTKPDTGLSLLIVDMGDCCVVKVEKGDVDKLDLPKGTRNPWLYDGSFAVFRNTIDAMDSNPPVPRIEKGLPCDFPDINIYQLITDEDENDKMHTFYSHEYEALCQLAGVTIPIYEGQSGTWTQLNTIENGIYRESDLQMVTGIAIWHYERRVNDIYRL